MFPSGHLFVSNVHYFLFECFLVSIVKSGRVPFYMMDVPPPVIFNGNWGQSISDGVAQPAVHEVHLMCVCGRLLPLQESLMVCFPRLKVSLTPAFQAMLFAHVGVVILRGLVAVDPDASSWEPIMSDFLTKVRATTGATKLFITFTSARVS